MATSSPQARRAGKLDTTEILAQPGFRMTPDERAFIRSNMPLPTKEGLIFADGVFEGGGVRGLAFLGALRCCDDAGIRWRKVAGTSAGAITASLVAADFPIDELEAIIGGMDFMDFLTQKTHPLILNGDPCNDLRSPIRMILLLLLTRRMGQYSSEPFRQWLEGNLAYRGLKTFADVQTKQVAYGIQRDLKVVASDISRGEMLVFPDDLDRPDPIDGFSLREQLKLKSPSHFSIAEAVRLSMSIPFFFEPGILGSSKRRIVDGGILSNFPLWIFDFRQEDSPNPGKVCPRWPTFGLRLVEDDNRSKPVGQVNGPFELLGAMFHTMMVARDQYHVDEKNRDRILEINITHANVTATQFNLTLRHKRALYEQGYCSMKQFLLQWRWKKHLEQRGFDPERCEKEIRLMEGI
jgi:NTE family protein